MQAIIIDLVLPPRLSFRSLVSLESLYGTYAPFFFLSLRMLMQFANAKSDLLIFAPSIILLPLLLEVEPLSDPARSINKSLENDVFLLLLLFISNFN